MIGTFTASYVHELWSSDSIGDGMRQYASESDGLRSLHNRTVFVAEFRVPGARYDVTATCRGYFKDRGRQPSG